MRNLAIPIVTTMLLAGCASIEAYKDLAKQKLAKTADGLLDDAVWWTCEGSSIGAVRRRFGRTGGPASAYRALCVDGSGVRLIQPPDQHVETEELPE